ncbi:unnamed protein product [Paramecium sonneborni]|uniref:Uncharacterized protein n=1 Tax=Paramecium sonneborni TaxID=65129 RepID=A0A8S1M518_9CILI|nr:unnamed protein product [Paramecium sonneborni]
MLNISDLKTDLQQKFQAVDSIEVPQKYISDLHKTIKTLNKLLKIRIRTDMPQLSINQFKDTMTELITISKQMADQILHKQTQSLQETQRQNDLEKRLLFLEENVGNQLKELTQQNIDLQNQIDSMLRVKEEFENQQTKLKEFELQNKQLKHEKDQLKSQNSNLQSLIRQLKEEKGSKIEKKLKNLKEEVSHVSQDYQKKLEQRDTYIERLEKELQIVKSELEMSEDYKMLTISSKKLSKSPEKQF